MEFETGLELVKEFVDPKVFFIIPVLWFIGVLLKTTPKVPDWTIVWIVTITGVVLSTIFIGFDVYGFSQGIMTSAVAVLSYDMFNQSKKAAQK